MDSVGDASKDGWQWMLAERRLGTELQWISRKYLTCL